VHEDYPFAGYSTFNGIGEMTGLHLVEEWGVLTSPVIMTSTAAVGMAWDAISRYGAKRYGGFVYKLPVVAETYDGFLTDMDAYPLRPEDVVEALESAASGPVAEGSVGGGTGMICYDFKGGIGSASRLVHAGGQQYTVGALVQANHGSRYQLRVAGAAVGEALDGSAVPKPWKPADDKAGTLNPDVESSSILVVLATDAPLLPEQCKRLARRAAVGLARTGGVGNNTSGDLFLAFATGNHYSPSTELPISLTMLPHNQMDPLIEAAAEAVEESILNALTAAASMTGYRGRKVWALPLDEMLRVVRKE
jgi:D-aminopeptidase